MSGCGEHDRDYRDALLHQTNRVLDCLGVITGDLNGVLEWLAGDSGLAVQVAANRLEDASGIRTALQNLATANARLRTAQQLLGGAGRIANAANAVGHLRDAADALEERESDFDPENLAEHSEAILGDLDIARSFLFSAASASEVIGLRYLELACTVAAGALGWVDTGVRVILPAIALRDRRAGAPHNQVTLSNQDGDLIPR